MCRKVKTVYRNIVRETPAMNIGPLKLVTMLLAPNACRCVDGAVKALSRE